nr:PIN domain-containing protein [Thioalkalivibrio sp. XN8]
MVDTNVLVYRVDPRDALKQQVAIDVLRDGLRADRLFVAHQSVLEFVAAVTRPQAGLNGAPLLERSDALLEAEALLAEFPVLYPNVEMLRTAIRGAATYGLQWFDAHLWACAEVNGLAEIISEDFQHGRHYGSVRAVNPFLVASGRVSELPAMYAT